MGKRAIHVVETAGDTTGLREFANGADSGLIMPQGTTAQRESSATEGTVRYNTSTTALEYTTGSDAWVTLGEVSSIDDINDVTITSASSGDFLKYDGSVWVNDPIDLSTDTVGNYVGDVTAGNGLSKTSSASEDQTVDLVIDINGATDGTGITVDSSADLVLLYDADAGAVKKVQTGQIATPTKLNSATIFFAANG
jgi:hypothetical protein